MAVRGLTKKQLITLIHKIDNDNSCITMDWLKMLFESYGDEYEVQLVIGDIYYKMVGQNSLWHEIRAFLPRTGDILKSAKMEAKKNDTKS